MQAQTTPAPVEKKASPEKPAPAKESKPVTQAQKEVTPSKPEKPVEGVNYKDIDDKLFALKEKGNL